MTKTKHKYTLFLMLVLSLFLSINVSHANNIRFRTIDDEDGLSQSTGDVILQDKKGYIWIGTADGLNKYNGHDFKVYRHDQWSENSIANNYIVSLEEDKEGYMWVGTANGLSRIDLETDNIKNYYSNNGEGSISHNNIGDILFTKDGTMLVATSNGLNIYNKESDRFERILQSKDDLTSQYIRELEEDKEGNIWIGTDNGINKLDIKTNEVTKMLHNESQENIDKSKYNDNVSLKYEDGHIWAGTFNSGLFKIDIKTNEIKHYINDEYDEKSIPGNAIRDIYKDKNGTMWIGTNKGLAILNDDDTFDVYSNKPNDVNSISNDIVYSIMQDKSGLMWIGTYAGISVFNPNNEILHYKNSINTDISLSENVIHGIYEDEEGLLWVGTKSKGINIIDRINRKVYYINKKTTNNLISDESINCITGKDSKIYIGTKDGLNVIDKNSKSIKLYDKNDGLCDENIKSLLIDSKNYLWVGTSQGINIINTENDEIIDLSDTLKKYNLESPFAKVIYEDSEGMYWIGCFIDNGLIKINPNDKSIKIYKHNNEDKTSISSNTVRSIEEDRNGNLWIGTSYGLNKLDKNTEKFTSFTTKDGLSNDTIYGILIDEYDKVWVSTNLGISKLNTESKVIQTFTVTDGLQGNEFNGNASYKTKDEELIFGGINGLNIFKPLGIGQAEYTPNVIFDSFEINGKLYDNINNMEFEHNQNFINISLFFPDYSNTKNVQYYYKLNEEDWNELKGNSINYSSLEAGNYTLKVKARSYNGLETDESSIKFTINPPFYKSDIAILIYIVLFIISLYFIANKVSYLDKLVKIRTSQLSKEMERSKELLNKVIELERRKNSYFINLSHELRTPLNVIYSTEQLINEVNKSENGIDKDKLSQYMNLISRNTKRLLNLINNLIDTTKIENGNYVLQLKENNIVYIVEEASLSLKGYIESKGIELIIDPEIEEKAIMCDATEIERCIVNLVSNATKFTPENGKIIVSVKEVKDKVVITVEDSGIGIEEKYFETIFNRFNQVVDANSEVKCGSGLGLTITKQIIELHNGQIYVESELNKGSRFTIIL